MLENYKIMKKIYAIYLFTFLIWGGVLFGWFINSDTYDNVFSVVLALILGVAFGTLAFGSLYLWLFTPVPKTYTIKKGKHYSGFRFKPFFRCKELEADVTFHDSCRYYEKDNTQLNHQINKLFGFGSINHHNNSNRLGWKYDHSNDRIQVLSYDYVDGLLITNHICYVGLREKIRLKIQSNDTYYLGKYLFPYFGGKAKSPHDIKISIYFK